MGPALSMLVNAHVCCRHATCSIKAQRAHWVAPAHMNWNWLLDRAWALYSSCATAVAPSMN